jgi:hypothetical protein
VFVAAAISAPARGVQKGPLCGIFALQYSPRSCAYNAAPLITPVARNPAVPMQVSSAPRGDFRFKETMFNLEGEML